METALAVLMVLGIYVVAPVLIGLGVVGIFFLIDRRAQRAECVKAIAEAEPGKLVAQRVTVGH